MVIHSVHTPVPKNVVNLKNFSNTVPLTWFLHSVNVKIHKCLWTIIQWTSYAIFPAVWKFLVIFSSTNISVMTPVEVWEHIPFPWSAPHVITQKHQTRSELGYMINSIRPKILLPLNWNMLTKEANGERAFHHWPLLLTCFNSKHSMDE